MIYLDYNATTPLCDAAREAMLPYLGGYYGNPSSVHAAGREIVWRLSAVCGDDEEVSARAFIPRAPVAIEELVVGARCHRPGIDVPGMRHHQRLREAQPRRKLLHAAEEIFEFGGEGARIARVERARDSGGTHQSHMVLFVLDDDGICRIKFI